MATTELSRAAERDLIDIYLYGAEHFGAAQAERYAKSLASKIATAADNPSFGVDYSHVRRGLRRYENVSHAIYYQPTSDGILVLRILHGRMDPARHLA
ncbi:type II toxin-antitoxin system RelE/ParE family toxin [Salipiger mangrovisoli]|uniref:Toxin n=1 Tax=Salipiger mangrovisoli TaxID=2865933 RepID=A0ABR9X8G0_9RHOB|nr:type II toxin-antitoxin system RelE/ParE family toxin [Salipiger mangrovisoli]